MSDLIQLKSLINKGEDADGREGRAPRSELDAQDSALASIRTGLNKKTGKTYWRSLEELAESDDFYELLHREFPEQASEWTDTVGRRKFLKLMGASLALAGLTACTRQPTETIAPYAKQPEEIVPGKPLFYATAMPMCGAAMGVLVESHEGRPTKIEGNPEHPASLGATDLFSQASVLSLYDPDRSQTLTFLGDIVTWPAFLGAVNAAMTQQRAAEVRGAGLRILTETVTSPTLAHQIRTMLADFPNAKWHQYEPAGGDGAREGTRMALGQYAGVIYHFDKADTVLSLDSDFLSCGPASVRYAHDFATKRRLEKGKSEINRLYAVDCSVTNTGSLADHRLLVRPSEVEGLARAIAAGVGAQAGQSGFLTDDAKSKWVASLVKDLTDHKGASIVIAGDCQPPAVHTLAHAMNQALGNSGKTVDYVEPVEANPTDGNQSLGQLVRDMDAGLVDTLVILGGNPVYNAPADLEFGKKMMEKVRLRIHLSLYKDETSELCQWHIPEAHYLESWSDARAYDGTATIIQPLISPLYGGKTAHEVVAAFSDQPDRRSLEIVRDYWQRRMAAGGQEPPVISRRQAATGQAATGQAASQSAPQAAQPVATQPALSQTGQTQAATKDFDKFWRKALHDGVIPDTAAKPKSVSVAASIPASANQQPASGYEVVFRPDPTIYDGRFANNGWLQELPKPVSKLTWDNAAHISPATAAQLGVGKRVGDLADNRLGNTGGELIADMIRLDYNGRSLTIPAWIQPGQPDNCVTVHLGYGRTIAGKVGTGTGFNAYSIRTSDAPWSGSGLQVTKTGDTYSLAASQLTHLIDTTDLKDREPEIVRSGTLEEYRENPSLAHEAQHEAHHGEGEPPSFFPVYDYSQGPAWSMAIDLNACVGCSACVVACQAENNIPVVGKEQVLRSREMHWLRVDSYYKGDESNPQTYFQPVPCMHCETAPCEIVCPVAATVHSAEGLNDMVYNRCVGTRYCSNNCPYKVRRFNFLLYQDFTTETLKLQRNPEVTVRSRGVMEKCTYCVQRIQRAKIEAEKEDRRVRDGEVQTACAQACPTRAIVFGDKNDSESLVARMKQEERNYEMLAELNTRPRTTYLAAVRNPNPELEKA
ncbi:MAG TPA: TAT-variant-translocated molybdopterin oxidoreductase [Blastocatellia bacterium]|nr:TAT-variant-translocated molybdopterin oxidoreductase [Blastocatellia bacterium]